MSNHKKRKYSSRTREAGAHNTRKRILLCARALFETEGFELVTIEKIARESTVSAPTIYALFRSKRGILRALMDEALPDEERLPLIEEASIEKSPEKRLLIAAKIARKMYDAEREQLDISSAAVLSPEFKELEKEREKRRYHRLEKGIEKMVLEKSLLKGLSPSKAHAILWALTGRDLYRMLVIEQGWTSSAYEKWLGELLIKSLLPPASI